MISRPTYTEQRVNKTADCALQPSFDMMSKHLLVRWDRYDDSNSDFITCLDHHFSWRPANRFFSQRENAVKELIKQALMPLHAYVEQKMG